MQPPRNSWPIGSASNAKQPEVITIYKPTSKLDLALFQLSTTIRRFIPYHFARDDFHSRSFELIETVLWNCFLQKFYTLYIYIYIRAFERTNYIRKIRVFIRWNNARSGALLRSSTTTSKTSIAILYRNDVFLQLHLRIQRRISVPESLEMSSPAARQTRKSENSVRE